MQPHEENKSVPLIEDTSPVSVPAKTEPLWTVDDVSRYLNFSPETVRAMAREGKIPAIKVGREWRFRASSLQKYLEETNLIE